MAESKSTPPETPVEQADIARTFAEIALRSKHLVENYYATQKEQGSGEAGDDLGVGKAFNQLATKLMSDPLKLAEASMRMWHDYFDLWQSTMRKAAGETTPPVAEPAKADNRFRSELWQSNLVFDYIKQSYLIASQNIQNTVAEVDGLDAQTARKVKFFTRQYIDALAPTNFVMTNPEVLKTTIESGGKNLLDGLNHLLQDLDRGHGKLAISMTDTKAFKLGENVATTPGKVVFQNDLMQLIQYQPTTQNVQRLPLLIVPPWINKYYILDLRQKNSFIRFALDQGITVFVVSWVNPDGRLAHKTFDDYMLEGPVAAFGAMEQATGEKDFNLIGYCLGGTLSAAMLAWMAEKGDTRVKSVTFFTTLIDFSEPGELGVFVDEDSVSSLEKKMTERGGYLEGAEMASTFNMLRANDLIWSFVVNNYLLGKEPFPFDLLYWNSDATRMPAKMHTFYLRNMYIRNGLREPGCVSLAGVPIDLGKIKIPAYFISTVEDHIAPWKTTYLGAQLLNGPVRFVLGGSGHIAGIVNPPAANKYWFWTNDKLRDTADEWLASAQKNEGSWWNDWARWITERGGEQVPARQPGEGKLAVIEDAPGSYAKLRLDDQTTQAPAPKNHAPLPGQKSSLSHRPREARLCPIPAEGMPAFDLTWILYTIYRTILADFAMAVISPIRLTPDLTEQVYQRLLNAICEGDLAPGSRLTQEDLAATLNVSRQPVLQALRMLKDGFVVDTGRRGLMVLPLGAQTISHIYEVRSALDGLAGRLAALAKAKIDMAIIDEGRKASKGSRISAMIDADMRFHNLIYTASGNPLIAETANHHWQHIRRAMGAVLQEARVRDSVWDEHEAILKAINRGDADRAERLARGHGEEAGHHLSDQLRKQMREVS